MTENAVEAEKHDDLDKHLQKYFLCEDWRNNTVRTSRDKLKRYASFDYCYNYFYSFKSNPQELASRANMQMSCLQLGFYLASWGMLRGSSFMLQISAMGYKKIITLIAEDSNNLWEIDVDNYDDTNVKLIIDFRDKLAGGLITQSRLAGVKDPVIPSDTLTSKIMLGVFGNVPAYDTFFINWIKSVPEIKPQKFNEKSLLSIKKYYDKYLKESMQSIQVNTIDFTEEQPSNIHYTQAKLIDIYGFSKGGGTSES